MKEDIRPDVEWADDDAYRRLAEDFRNGDFEVEEVESFTPPTLKMGRPAGQPTPRGATPVRSFRLPTDLTAELDSRAEHDHVSSSEIVRRALEDFLH